MEILIKVQSISSVQGLLLSPRASAPEKMNPQVAALQQEAARSSQRRDSAATLKVRRTQAELDAKEAKGTAAPSDRLGRRLWGTFSLFLPFFSFLLRLLPSRPVLSGRSAAHARASS